VQHHIFLYRREDELQVMSNVRKIYRDIALLSFVGGFTGNIDINHLFAESNHFLASFES
jgi:hypothetical protein